MGHRPIVVANIEQAIECVAVAFFSGEHPTKDPLLLKAIALLCGPDWMSEVRDLLARHLKERKGNHAEKDPANSNGHHATQASPETA